MDDRRVESFRVAPMSPLVLTLTAALLALPIVFLVGALSGRPLLAIPLALFAAVYAWVWLRFRPSRFAVHPGGLDVVWPLKRSRTLPRADIETARVVDRRALLQEIGWGLRVGAGGLWGGFGWLWTTRRGVVQMYITRTDRFVWIECVRGRPWLITPARPEAFVRVLRTSPDAGY